MQSSGWSTDYASGYSGHYQFAQDGQEVNLDNGQIAKVVIPGFIYNHARFDYNESDKLYYRSEFGSAQVDGTTGNQLAYKNIIIQECPSTMFDEKEAAGTSRTAALRRLPGRRKIGVRMIRSRRPSALRMLPSMSESVIST